MAFSHITSWQIEGEKVETVTDFIFLDSQITADSDYSREIKRCLLLEKKAMTNLDSVLKSRDITLPTKVQIVKAMVFPVVMYRCESWLNAEEMMLLNCGAREDSWEFLGHKRRSNQSILKEINSEYSLEGLILKMKLQYIDHLIRRADSLEKTLMLGKTEGKRRGRQRMKRLNSITNSMDMNLSKLQETAKDREAWNAAVYGISKSQT